MHRLTSTLLLLIPNVLSKNRTCLSKNSKMSKSHKTKNSTVDSASNQQQLNQNSAIYLNKSNRICVNIQVKPGANQTGISDIQSDAITVKVAAPPVDGEANKELVKYMTKFLELKNGDVNLETGAKSRNKTLQIDNCKLTIEQLMEKFKSNVD